MAGITLDLFFQLIWKGNLAAVILIFLLNHDTFIVGLLCGKGFSHLSIFTVKVSMMCLLGLKGG